MGWQRLGRLEATGGRPFQHHQRTTGPPSARITSLATELYSGGGGFQKKRSRRAMSEMIERTCEICGEPVSGCGYVLRTICSPACYGVRDKRQRHAEDRRIVRAWEERL